MPDFMYFLIPFLLTGSVGLYIFGIIIYDKINNRSRK